MLYIVEPREDGVHYGIKKLNRDTGHYAWHSGHYKRRSEAERVCAGLNAATPGG